VTDATDVSSSRFGWWTMHFRQHPRGARASGERVQARIRGDAIEPVTDRGSAVEARNRSPRAQQCVLDEVLGIMERAEHAIAVDLQLSPVRLSELLKRLVVATLRHREEVPFVRLVPTTLVHELSFPQSDRASSPVIRSNLHGVYA